MLSQQCSCRSPALQVMRVEPEMKTTLSSENIWPLLTEPAVRPSPPPCSAHPGLERGRTNFRRAIAASSLARAGGHTLFCLCPEALVSSTPCKPRGQTCCTLATTALTLSSSNSCPAPSLTTDHQFHHQMSE